MCGTITLSAGNKGNGILGGSFYRGVVGREPLSESNTQVRVMLGAAIPRHEEVINLRL